ncbi:MAG: DUF354 domain-containing protein [Bacteroidota bacterium]
MRILFHLGHPAHFHLFKNVIAKLLNNGNKIDLLIKDKDVLRKLLEHSSLPYKNILPEGKTQGKFGLFYDLIVRGKNIYSYCREHKPDVLVGTSADISYLGELLNIPTINVNEDDAHVVPMYAWMAYPFASSILSPESCDNGRWDKKTVKYAGYHELAYLHPDHFTPDEDVIAKYLGSERNFVIMRFASLNAHHDDNIRGINDEIALRLIEKLKPSGRVLITSERELSSELESYRLSIDPIDIHHFLSFAKLVIGDSQTMSAEAAVLGTPYIRFNDFVNKIGYLKELEEKYELGFGITPDKPEELIEKSIVLVSDSDLKQKFENRRKVMLAEKINTAEFIFRYIIDYLDNK